MQKTVAQAVDVMWDSWFKGLEMFLHSGRQLEQAIVDSLERQQQLLAQSAENAEKVKREIKEHLEQFREKTEKELQTMLGDETNQVLSKWAAQFDEIAERLMQIALTPSKQFFNASQAFHKQTANILKQFLSQQQSGREEAEKMLKSYFEHMKETQKAIVEKASDYTFFK
jgi:gas vesicle protein